MKCHYLCTYHDIWIYFNHYIDSMESYTILSSKEEIDRNDSYKSVYNKLLQHFPESTAEENCNSSMLFIDLKKLDNKHDKKHYISESDDSIEYVDLTVYDIDATILIRTSVPKTTSDMLQLYVVVETADHEVISSIFCIPQEYTPIYELEHVLSKLL